MNGIIAMITSLCGLLSIVLGWLLPSLSAAAVATAAGAGGVVAQ